MTNPAKPRSPPQLAATAAKLDEAKPFDGDLFSRKPIADQLTVWVDRMPGGGVLGIDAAWGDGKTWFGRNWNAQLKASGRQSVYIDAFAVDYVADPFLLLAAELAALWKVEDGGTDWKERVLKVGKVVLPSVVTGLSRGLLSTALGKETVGGLEKGLEAAGEAGENVLTGMLKVHIDDLEQRTKSVEALKAKLAERAQGIGSPIIIFIDELDRCRPDFSLMVLERVKHFFEVPGVVFVLLLNRKQLEASVRHTYGPETDATDYLHRFVTFFVSLPRREANHTSEDAFYKKYLYDAGSRLGYQNDQKLSEFCTEVGALAPVFGLTLRSCERVLAYYGIAAIGQVNDYIFPYLAILRVVDQKLFERLKKGELKAYSDAWSQLQTRFTDIASASYSVRAMNAVLDLAVHGEKASDRSKNDVGSISSRRLRDGSIPFVQWQAGLLDLDVR